MRKIDKAWYRDFTGLISGKDPLSEYHVTKVREDRYCKWQMLNLLCKVCEIKTHGRLYI